MRILLVYPEYPRDTYWSFSHALPYIGRRAPQPPLGLITVAALLPESYEVRLVDMNVEPLLDEQIRWADAVFTSTMLIQAPSLADVTRRCRRLGVPVVAGGPHPSSAESGIDGVDHLVAGEAEQILPAVLADLEKGRAKPVYRAEGLPEVTEAPLPRFDLLDMSAYASMSVQYSRGCPFRCEFCDIWTLYGRQPRVKETAQFLAELDALEAIGWRGNVFVVDDNFIGNPKVLKPFLRELAAWQEERGYPFGLFTEASMNLARDEELLREMRTAGFSAVFLGIETPSVESLLECHKTQNTRSDLLEDIRTIQGHGLEVFAGFIVGFDNDTEDIFDRQIEFIQEAGIPVAMVGILNAIPGTELAARLEREGRLRGDTTGNNTHLFETNFVTRMPAETLSAGYKKIIAAIYDPSMRNYFRRCRRLLERLGPNPHFRTQVGWREIRAALRSLGVVPFRRYGRQYLRFLMWTLFRRPEFLGEAIRMGIFGFHFRAITASALASAPSEEAVSMRAVRALAESAAPVPRSTVAAGTGG
jgi:radical SAM superfamily enzyme YgiQ (UPF0313 family)